MSLFARQTALPGWGASTQDKVQKAGVRVSGSSLGATSCRDYLDGAGVAAIGVTEFEILFERTEASAPRALLAWGRGLALWSKSEGPCLNCLSLKLGPEGKDWGILMGSLAADLVLTALAGLAEWKAGRMIRVEDDGQTKEEWVEATPGCPACRGTPSLQR